MSSEMLFFVCCIAILLTLQLAFAHGQKLQSNKAHRRVVLQPSKPSHGAKHQRKPDWIRYDILRLRALMPDTAGVRQIAAVFNRIQASKAPSANLRVWRVSKTYVANLLRSHQCELKGIRDNMRQRQSGISAICQTWGIDLTGKKDTQGQLHHILGIIDHGSRLLVRLIVTSKHSTVLARHLLTACLTHGQPKRIRTDNERCFTSDSFAHCLQAFSIHLQTTELHCPWQNGRIERLFGTLKQQLHQVQVESGEQLQDLLDEFKHWYNSMRLHQHLRYQTPQEVWQQQKQRDSWQSVKTTQTAPTWWTGWNGQLSGVQWQC